jgi:hypothetical protein
VIVVDAWLGGLAYSDIWAALFLAVGAGAVSQIVYEPARLEDSHGQGRLATPIGAAGVLVAMLLTYVTGLLVA